ncbi:hypothetical protein VT84_07930 [Gemmata sp. SH-PL17]|uniref:DUF1003 domain-containing protein n=1 Tax=Gemmata sp. SH-PL17 TaxID=1630693 RepID=UPI00078B9AD8|nr:DUF1003 domain-containing protein [Gemmata sp. SH-PL17]AMV24310.1 hypothetical protein VT84_07930 [Gemmata sp. SH-PL17]
MQPQFPERYEHDHPPVRNVNEVVTADLSWGAWAADRVAGVVGSWWFIGTQSAMLLSWAALNVVAWLEHWDPYPFILMNLFLSLQAAYTAPMIMMSQNRVAAMDRVRAQNDYEINLKAEEEIRVVLEHLEAQSVLLRQLQQEVREMRAQLGKPEQ